MKQIEKEFAALVKEQKSTIYSICYMFSKDKEEIDDLFQETLIHLWQGFEKFRNESKIETWVYRVTLGWNDTLYWRNVRIRREKRGIEK